METLDGSHPVQPVQDDLQSTSLDHGDALAVHGISPVVAVGGALRLLLVDDSIDSATAMAMLLEADGYEVRVAHEAAHALAIAAQFEPEIVLLDLGLPGMDGFQLGEALRQHPSTAQTLLIAVTGYGHATDRERSRAAGFDHHLVKPVSSEEIQRVINSRFPGGRR